jgi:hypothetical protein
MKLKLILKDNKIIAGYIDPKEEAIADALLKNIVTAKTKTPCG